VRRGPVRFGAPVLPAAKWKLSGKNGAPAPAAVRQQTREMATTALLAIAASTVAQVPLPNARQLDCAPSLCRLESSSLALLLETTLGAPASSEPYL
jgi:hypothetical protein